MTRLSRVVWNEGMHLAQHHFQTQNRYYEESIRFAVSELLSEPVGLAAAGFDHDGLLNGVVSLTHARGIMPDGTPFQIPEADEPPAPLDLNPIFQPTEHRQTVFLALPPLRPGAANCATDSSEGLRYIAETQNLLDETTGLDERPVLGESGGAGNVQRQRRGRTGQHDRDAARLRNEFEGDTDDGPHVAVRDQ